MSYTDKIFKARVPDFDLLQKYGFVKKENNFVYVKDILAGRFNLTIKISLNGEITTKLIDKEVNDEYILHLVEFANGEFVTSIKAEYERVLKDIQSKCFKKQVFRSFQAKNVIDYCYKKYGDCLEFLWEKVDDNAIIRRKDTRKWYAVFMLIAKNKLGLEGEEIIEVLNLKLGKEKVSNLIDNKKYFKAYHMNKNYWITILLDESKSVKEILNLVDISHSLAK